MLPLGLFFVAFVGVPLALVALISLHSDTAMTHFGMRQYLLFFGDSYNRGILWQTLMLGVATTLATIVLGYPVAHLYVVSRPRWRRLLMVLILLPLLTSSVVRTFAWVVILGNEGLVNALLVAFGRTGEPVRLLYTPLAVILSLAQIELPLMVLPLVTTLMSLDTRLPEASHALGASSWCTWWKITVPLAMPGLLSGTLLVFTGAVSAFVVQTLVGGGQLMYMPFYIYEQAIQTQNYPFAATLAVILLLSVLLVVTLLNYFGRKTRGFVHG
ncbi:ABC transporter permease [Paraburkholderia sp. MM5496-R1]|uniref:ABC transporter permease n=1 Tax=Paraburkholderia sp. MM5496-R1 TaxID=2991065 RepID=UPI003D1D9A28